MVFVLLPSVSTCVAPFLSVVITRLRITVLTQISAAVLTVFNFSCHKWRYLFEGGAYSNIVPDKFTFSKFFIQRYTFYLLIFLWTDTKLIVNLKLKEKFRRWKKPESFMITRAKISVVRASEAWHLF